MSDDNQLGPKAQFLQHLHELGAVLWTGGEGFGGAECSRPPGWQNLTCQENLDRLTRFHGVEQPYICANTGIPVAVVDVDPKNGGDVEKVRALLAELGVRIYAEVTTPSGGVHFYIAGHPDLPTVHSKADNPKLPGFPGLDIQSHGANVFAPGTLRSKYGGTGYTIVFDELHQMPATDGDEPTRFTDWVAEQLECGVKAKARKISGGAKEWAWDPCEPWDGTPPDRRQKSYLHAALAREAEKVRRSGRGGRNDALFVAALKCGSYIAGAGLEEARVISELRKAAVDNGYTADDGQHATDASIRSGLRAGKKKPRAVPPPKSQEEKMVTAAPQPSPGAVTVDLEGFWELTPTLRHIRDWAYARLVGPWAVLGVCLARVVAVVPPTVQLPPWACGNASLNLFVALVGLSGDGKGGPEKTAKEAFRLGPVYTTGIGSGQGINHLFAHYDGRAKTTVMDRWSVYFSVPEVDTIASERGRTGSNLLPQLRKAWSGEDLTFAYVDRAKAVQVLEHAYRLSMVVGVQPARAGTLINDIDGGTPQRYLWLPADAPGTPMEDVEAPEPIDLREIAKSWPEPQMELAARLQAAQEGRAVVRSVLFELPVAARDLVRTNRKLKLQKKVTDPLLDGHLGLCRMKAAAALALLHGERDDAGGRFWEMSEALMAKSQETRASVEAQLAEKERGSNRARGRAEGERAVVAEEVRDDAAIKRVGRNIVRWLTDHADGKTLDQVRKGCVAGRDKKYCSDAVARLVQAGTVAVVGNQVKLV